MMLGPWLHQNEASADQRRRTRLGYLVVIAVILSGMGYASVQVAKHSLGPLPLTAAFQHSKTVVDRNGQLLRAFTTPEGRWRLPLKHDEVDEKYLAILFAFEDRRFWSHGGVDILALLRAVDQLVRHGRIVSGASTLTMQVARLVEGRHERSALGKFRQMVRAWQLEERFSKREILNIYLRLAPFGGNLEGVRAASLAYFGKEPTRLSVGEAALLVALPQSPEARRPDRDPVAAQRARDRVLKRAVAAGILSRAEANRAQSERVPAKRRSFPRFAPHLSETEVAANPNDAIHRLTLERNVQSAMERLALSHAQALGAKLSSAILVVDHTTGDILAHVGSADYLDSARLGAVDMVSAVRSPGSTLKPIIYGLGFESGLAHPETLIEDRPARFGSYKPKNFDQGYRGTVSIREALGASLNIPAVRVLDAVGPARLIARLRNIGAQAVLPDNARPSLAVALGGIGLRLRDLAMLYSALANGGQYVHLTHRNGESEQRTLSGAIADDMRKVLLPPVSAWYVSDILKDAPPPAHTKAGRIAYKTGTSYGYRDAWAVGYDGKHAVAVWVGRADGTSSPGLTGRTAAAPILFDAFARLSEQRVPLRSAPKGALRDSGGQLPPPLKRFGRDEVSAVQGRFLESPVSIAFPPDRSEFEVGGNAPDPLLLKAEGGVLPLTWLVDGEPIDAPTHRRDVVWQPPGHGFARVSVIDARGYVDRVTVRLK